MKKYFLLVVLSALALLPGCQNEAQEQKTAPFVKVLKDTLDVGSAAADEQLVMIQATEGAAWQAVVADEGLDWISLIKNSGVGSGRLAFNVAANDGTGIRTAEIVVTGSAPDGTALDGGSLVIRQIGSAPALLATPNGVMSVSSDASSRFVINVTSNVEWKAEAEVLTGDAGWASVSSPVGTLTGSGEAVFAFSQNETENSRDARLSIVSVDDPTLKVSLTVTQQRAPAKYGVAIPGMSGFLPDGDGAMVVMGGGKEREYDCSISCLNDTTVISFEKKLSEGEYVLVSVFPKGGSDIALGATFTVDAEGATTLVSKWLAPFESFGGDSEDSPILVSKASQIKAIADAVNGGDDLAGKFFKQTEDISLAEYNPWPGIGTASNRFSGSYDGDSKTVSALSVSSGDEEAAASCGMALFRHIGSAQKSAPAAVKNLTVAGSATATAGFVAGIVALCDSNAVLSGLVNKVAIEAVLGSAMTDVAGVVGCISGGNVKVQSCRNQAAISCTSGGAAQLGSNGGIVGRANGKCDTCRVVIEDCANEAAIAYLSNTGGILGRTDAGYVTISRCANYGNLNRVNLTVVHVAGIAATVQGKDVIVDQCFNKGLIDGYRHTGGVLGYVNATGSIQNCYNVGEVKGQGNTGNNGGIVGNYPANVVYGIRNCYNAGAYALLDKNAAPTTVDKNDFGAVVGGLGIWAVTTDPVLCYWQTGIGMVGGLVPGKNNQLAQDKAGMAEGKDASFFTGGTAIEGWDTSIWKFEAGKYPQLIANPEK